MPSVRRVAPPFAWAETAERARQLARAHVSTTNLPAVSVAVGVGDALVWAEGFGWADLTTHTTVTPDTAFRLGTASIVLTSAAAGVLVERGQLGLDDEIQKYVPEFPRASSPVTLAQLMAHTAGVPPDGGDEGPLFAMHCRRVVEALPGFASWPLQSAPGTHFRLSAHGWVLVSAAIEAAAHEPFQRVLRKTVFEPLGMDATRIDGEARAGDRATSYFPRLAAEPRYGADLMRDLDLSCHAGAGDVISTPEDLVRFGNVVVAGRLVAPATMETLLAAQHLASGEETGYGLGWDLDQMPIGGQITPVVGRTP